MGRENGAVCRSSSWDMDDGDIGDSCMAMTGCRWVASAIRCIISASSLFFCATGEIAVMAGLARELQR